jgi:hypothetical protein
MWATLHAFEHSNLDGMTLISAPKYGQTLLRSWARKHLSDHVVKKRPKVLGYICLSEGLLQIACCMFSLGPLWHKNWRTAPSVTVAYNTRTFRIKEPMLMTLSELLIMTAVLHSTSLSG